MPVGPGGGHERRRTGPAGPYAALGRERDDEHPVDLALERLAPLRELRARIRDAARRLAKALGERREPWLEVEALLNDYRVAREEACFDLGFEHGLAAGRAQALRRTASPQDREALALADRIRDEALLAGLPAAAVVTALLKAAWALVLGLADQPTPTGRRNP